MRSSPLSVCVTVSVFFLFSFFCCCLLSTTCIPCSVAQEAPSSHRSGLFDIASSTGDLLSKALQKPRDLLHHAVDYGTNLVQGAVDNSAQLLLNATRATGEVAENAASWGLNFKLRRSMEKFRSRMRYGIAELDVPILEPFHLQQLRFSTDNPEIGDIDFYFNDLTVYGLSTFVIDRAKLSVITPAISFNVSIPKVFVTANYNVSGILAKKFSIFGAGPCEITFDGLRIYVNTKFGYYRGLYVKTFDLDFHLKSILYNFENFMGDNEIGRTMNQVFQQLTPQIMEIVKPDILPQLKDYLGNMLNETVHDLTVTDLFNVLLGEAIIP